MLKLKKKKRLSVFATIFALVLTASVVYAAFAGALTFQGSVTLSPETSLIFINNDSRTKVSDDGQIITFTIDLDNPLQTVDISLKVHNNGNTTVKVADQIRDYIGSPAVIYYGLEALLDQIVSAGETIEFDMTFGLDVNDPYALDTKHEFKFMLDYEMVP